MPVRPTRSVHLVARMLRLGAIALCAACAVSSATAQVTALKAPARTLITARIDPQQRVALQGHVATWARVEHDRGAVPDDTSLTGAVHGVAGLHTTKFHPTHRMTPQQGVLQGLQPQMNGGSGTHYVSPADFAKIYDLPASYNGSGQSIAIASKARVYDADDTN